MNNKPFDFDLNSPAIIALGPLFKLTQVFIWDDGYSSNKRQSTFPKHIRFKYDDDEDADDDTGGKIGLYTSLVNAEETVMEDEMSALGLPVSFKTSKQKSGGQTKGKSKAVSAKNQHSQKRPDDRMQNLCDLSKESPSLVEFPEKSSNLSLFPLPCQSEHSCSGSDVADDILRLSNFCREEKPADGAAEVLGDGLEEHVHDLQNQSTFTLNGNLLEADMLMETEMMSVDHAYNFSAANSCCESNVLDDCFEHNMKEMVVSLTEQVNAQGSRLDSNRMQPENFGSTITVDQTEVNDLSNESQNMMVLGQDNDDSVRCSIASDGWSAYWDSFYMRYFYYNAKTQESTWYPPLGMEGFASDDISCTFSGSEVTETNTGLLFDQGEAQSDRCEFAAAGLSFTSTMHSDNTCDRNLKESLVLDRHCTIEHSCLWENGKKLEASDDMCNGNLNSKDSDLLGSSCLNADRSSDGCLSSRICTVEEARDAAYISEMHLDERDTKADDIQMQDTPAGTKKKTRRKNRRRKNLSNHSKDHDIQWAEESYSIDTMKYWRQRYYLFSRFDDGIEMDDEGWFSVTPEAIARHQASRSGGGIVIDCFTGVGGNAIQFAKTSQHVIAIDIDPKKIGYAHHNASIYGVADNIDFIMGDSLSLVSKLKADTVFLSPPWGGPDYVEVKSYDINMLQPYDGELLFNTFKEIASMIIMFLPRNVDIEQLAELSLSANPPWSLEVEKNFLNEGLKAVTAYFRRT